MGNCCDREPDNSEAQNHEISSNSPSEKTEERPQLMGINDQDSLPIQHEERSCTDVLCIGLGILFTVIMIVLAISVFSYDTYLKSSFPTDSDGKLCGADLPAYPYIYFAHLPEIGRRVCVSQCPKEGDTRLQCYTTEEVGCRFSQIPGLQVTYYPNVQEADRLGMFCMPTDEKLKDDLLVKTELKNKYLFLNSVDTIFLCIFVALGMSIVYCILTQCCPKFMNKAAVVVGLVMTFGLMLCFFTYSSGSDVHMPLGICFLILFVILAFNAWVNRKTFEMQGVYLEAATKMLKDDKCCVFAYIPIFFVFAFLFTLILIFEFKSFVGGGSLHFDKDSSLYWEFTNSNAILLALLVLQAVWGYSFIKEAFNFCVSGNAVAWYYSEDWPCQYPFQILFTTHFGSVIAGSFMTGFFSVGDYLFDLLKPSDKNGEGCYASFFNCFFSCCLKVFDLVRSDAMAFINLTGEPYCNSARACEYLCDKSLLLEQSQSTSRTYRIAAHFLIAAAVSILALYMKGTVGVISVLFIVFMSLVISTFFISIHADAAEAIIILFLNNEELESRRLQLRESHINRKDFRNFEKFDFKHPELVDEVRKVREAEGNG